MKRYRVVAIVVCVLLLAVVGCATYYKVSDPTGGKVYYTEKVKRLKSGSGAVEFKDAKTGSSVTLQSSEVLAVPKKEFKENTKK